MSIMLSFLYGGKNAHTHLNRYMYNDGLYDKGNTCSVRDMATLQWLQVFLMLMMSTVKSEKGCHCPRYHRCNTLMG